MGRTDATGIAFTCPSIDHVIDEMNEMMMDLGPGSIISTYEYEQMQECYRNAVDELETVRASNTELRDRCLEAIRELNELEKEKDDEIDELESDIRDLENEVAHLEHLIELEHEEAR